MAREKSARNSEGFLASEAERRQWRITKRKMRRGVEAERIGARARAPRSQDAYYLSCRSPFRLLKRFNAHSRCGK